VSRLLNLYKAQKTLESIVISYIKKELVNMQTFGSWFDEAGVYFEMGINEKPKFVSYETLELWAEKNYAEGETIG